MAIRVRRSTPHGIGTPGKPLWLTLSLVLAPLLLIGGCDAPSTASATRAPDENAAAASSIPADIAAVPVTPEAVPEAPPVAAPTPEAGAATGALPQDVRAFKARRDECDHFRGEEPSDEARAAQLEQKLEQTCKGTDATLAGLRRRYDSNPAAIAALADYEDSVE